MSRLPSDQTSRAAALDTNQSFIVEAPAGSGKTTLLIQRFLSLLVLADDPEEVVAITFTVRATRQMRNKVLAGLRCALLRHSGACRPDKSKNKLEASMNELALNVIRRDVERGWNLCDHPQRLRIMTIDSFSAEIAGRLPLLARLGSTLEPTDRPEAMYRTAARKTLDHLAEPTRLGAAVKILLMQHDNDLERCLQLIADMLACRTQWKMLLGYGPLLGEPAVEQNLRAILEAAPRHAVAECLRTLQEHLDEHDCRLLHELLRYGAKWKPGLAQDPDWPVEHDFSTDCAERWRLLTDILLKREPRPAWYSTVTKTQGFLAGSSEKQELLEFLERHTTNDELLKCFGAIRSMPSVAYSDEQWANINAYVRVLTQAVAELKLVFAENAKVDFSEVALAAAHALRDTELETDIAASFGTRIRHILIDELQDTSAIQYELLNALTSGWDGVSQTVFAVGDPKQSIYAFRQAQVHLFRQMQTRGLGRLHLANVQLTVNFRSQAALVDTWNDGFSAIFTQRRPDDIPFSEAAADRTAIPDVGMEVHPWLVDDDSIDARDLAERGQARSICSIIQRHIAAHTSSKPLSIAVLARARTHLPVLLEEFRKFNIRYRALEIDALGEMQGVRDVVALTRCLLHPSDRIAWLAVLRAPWCGLTLADLHALCQGDALSLREACIGELLEQDLSALTAEGRNRCVRVGQVLQVAMRERNRIALTTLVERTWHSLGGPACVTSHQRDNIEQYLQFLRATERENAISDFRALEVLLNRFYALPQSFNPGETVVDILTIHGAKGLEWDTVFVPELQRKGAFDVPRLLNWIEYPALEQGVVLAPAGASDDFFYRWFCSLRSQQQEAERKRLFYVACTRARDELHLYGTVSLKKNGDCAVPNSESLLSTAWPMLEGAFVEAARRKRETATTASPKILAFPHRLEPLSTVLPAIAATASDVVQVNQRRLPAGWRPPASPEPLFWTRSSAVSHDFLPAPPFTRAEGSIVARSTGGAIHSFLEKITREFAAGKPFAEIQAGVSPMAIASVVRGLGVSPDAQATVATEVAAAISRMLRDPIGRWLLGPRRGAMTEAAISATIKGTLHNARVDRAFLAGDMPNAPGEDTLWVVDYKTGQNGRTNIDEFLLEQQQFYSPQMTTYASLVQPLFAEIRKVRLGLYFPSLGRFHQWIWSEQGEQF